VNLIYKHENTLKIISIVFSLVAWLAILYFSKGLVLVYVLLFALGYLFAQSGFISHLRGTGVRVSADQYTDVFRALAESCQKLGIDPVPECYILRTNTFNALATRFLGRNFVVLFADVVEALREQPDALRFYIGHELGHLARRHLQWQPFLMPASFLPLLGAAHHRAKEYTCDRHGLASAPNLEAAQHGLLAIATSGSRLASTNVGGYIEQSQTTGAFWMSFHELIGDYPWLTKRVAEVTAVAQGTTASHPARNLFAWILAAFIPRFGSSGGASLVITVALIGVLAAIAIPAYQDYTIRAQVASSLGAADAYKAVVAETFTAGGNFDEMSSDNLSLPAQPASPYLDSVRVFGGAVVLQFGGSANRLIVGKQLVLVPGRTKTEEVVWTCGLAPAPDGVIIAFDDHAKYTDVPAKYLPPECRPPAAGQ
jgi:Zn-dependent protease with chaperone function/type II secretory pathway pseudopilin PulG